MERTGKGDPERNPELRGIAGSGPSKVGVDGAMRARDVSRPSAEQVAEAVAAAKAELTAKRGAAGKPSGHGGSGGSTPVDS